jgi:hypothetical protein
VRTRIWPSYDGSVSDSVYPTIPMQIIHSFADCRNGFWCGTRTCLEYTFARDAFSLGAEAYSAESGTIDEFEDSIWGIFCLTCTELGNCDGRCRKDMTLRSNDGWPWIGAQVQV